MELAEWVKFLEKNTRFWRLGAPFGGGGLLATGGRESLVSGRFPAFFASFAIVGKVLGRPNIRIQRDLRSVRHYFATLPAARE